VELPIRETDEPSQSFKVSKLNKVISKTGRKDFEKKRNKDQMKQTK